MRNVEKKAKAHSMRSEFDKYAVIDSHVDGGFNCGASHYRPACRAARVLLCETGGTSETGKEVLSSEF